MANSARKIETIEAATENASTVVIETSPDAEHSG
jgi:hypothetical protein